MELEKLSTSSLLTNESLNEGGVSDPIKCHCGLEYNVELGRDAMGAR
uniref:Uncharacterized protein n=1 Tax=Triticum urartu TaxID=4572 RepID=A0A8R7UAK6_TRIUA